MMNAVAVRLHRRRRSLGPARPWLPRVPPDRLPRHLSP